MKLDGYLIDKYINSYQGYELQVEHKLYCIKSESFLDVRGRIKEISDDDMVNYENRLGRATLTTYNDILVADEAEVYKVIYEIDNCDEIAIIYEVNDINEGRRYYYIEIFKEESIVVKYSYDASSYDDAVSSIKSHYLSSLSSQR
jgi:hypothetical protein